MTALRQQFLVDKLRHAAEGDNPLRLNLMREIIKHVKLMQLEHVAVADDAMMLTVIKKLRGQKQQELLLMDEYLAFALQHNTLATTEKE